ncbi:MAG TPA: DUF2461 domain-containing protein [Chitinophagaceae bacterium]|jgi:uncharacterized protein (TIGR02453 family)|nr:DUF2461 domain-containing protein [Chitinophagaceae bacterium]
MLEPQTLTFLKQLKKNNNKPWFDAHRVQYEAARIDFQNFIQLVMDALEKTDPSIAGQTARSCLFRINRDVRFSKDKSPYKTNFGASIKAGGRKSALAGYYFHLEPGASFIGGGLWMPEPARVKAVRQEIDYCWDEFRGLLAEKKFRSVYGDLYQHDDIRLATAPKGYEKDHPALPYLKLKCFIAETPVADEDLLTAALHKKTVVAFTALQPMLQFINRTVE